MNGGNLADWQEVVNGLNERIQAMGQFKTTALEQIPVPTSINHITNSFMTKISESLNFLFNGNYPFWCDPDRPLVIAVPGDPGWSGIYQTGRYIWGPTRWVPFQVYPYQYQGDFDTRSIFESVPKFNCVPLRGAELVKVGDFLDWVKSTLLLLTKTSKIGFDNLNGKQAYLRWEQSTGEIVDITSYETVGTASTFADFYSYAVNNLTDYTSTGTPICQKRIYNDGTYIWLTLRYESGKILYGYGWLPNLFSTPGGIHSDLTVYYSSLGDDCGFPVNSSSTHIDYSTVTYQNVGPETPINFGFNISSISTVPVMPSAGDTYEKQESFQEINGVWDFTNYFHYCI